MGLKDTILGWFDSIGANVAKKVTINYPRGKKTKGIETHGAVLKKAHRMFGHSNQTLLKAAHTLATAPTAPASARALASAQPTLATARGRALVGALAALSPKVKAAQDKRARAVAQSKAATQDLARKIIASKGALTNLARIMVAQKKLAMTMRRPHGASAHIGLDHPDMTLAEAAEVMSADGEYEFIGQADPSNPPDPTNPGYLMDGSPDPNAPASVDSSGGAPPPDPTAGLQDTPIGNQIDNGQISFPAPPDMTVAYADMTTVGGVAYDGSKGYPDGFAGSYGLFTRQTDRPVTVSSPDIDPTEHYGYVWGQFDWKNSKLNGSGIPWGSSLHSGKWNWVHGRHILGSEDWHTDVINPAPMFASVFAPAVSTGGGGNENTAFGVSYGPIVGNPALPDFAHMRCDAQGNFFWLPQEAPDWLTFPLKQAAAITAKATADAAAAASAANAAAIKKINDDAAVAAAQAAADAATQQAATDAATQAANVQTAQAQGQLSQTTAQQAQDQASQEQQAGALMLQMAQQQMAQQAAPQDQGQAQYQDQGQTYQSTGVDEGGGGGGIGPEDLTPAEQAEGGQAGDFSMIDMEPVPELESDFQPTDGGDEFA